MKRTISMLLALIMLLCTGSMIPFASANSLSEEEYLSAVHEIMKHYAENPEWAVEQLALLDTTLIQILLSDNLVYPCEEVDRNNPSDYSMSVYCTSRGSSSLGYTYYIMWSLTAKRTENNPGPIDHLSIEWDTQYGSYHSASYDGEYSTLCDRSTGVVVFNVEDDELVNGKTTTGSVRVNPVKSGRMEFGAKFIHSYNLFSPSAGSSTISFVPSANLSTGSLQLEYTDTLTVSFSSTTDSWQRWEEGAATLVA